MRLDQLYAPLELKFAADAPPGSFAGYGAVFGNTDSGGDRIVQGAFSNALVHAKAEGRGFPMYMQHGAALGGDPRPVGVWDSVEEDSHGLKVAGRIVGLDTETGRYNYALVKEGAMRGLSIGYRVKSATYGKAPGEPNRTIKELALGEISIVDEPMNTLARVDGIKARCTEREFERLLTRDAGFSRSEALFIMDKGFKSFIATRDAGEDEVEKMLAALRRRGQAIA